MLSVIAKIVSLAAVASANTCPDCCQSPAAGAAACADCCTTSGTATCAQCCNTSGAAQCCNNTTDCCTDCCTTTTNACCTSSTVTASYAPSSMCCIQGTRDGCCCPTTTVPVTEDTENMGACCRGGATDYCCCTKGADERQMNTRACRASTSFDQFMPSPNDANVPIVDDAADTNKDLLAAFTELQSEINTLYTNDNTNFVAGFTVPTVEEMIQAARDASQSCNHRCANAHYMSCFQPCYLVPAQDQIYDGIAIALFPGTNLDHLRSAANELRKRRKSAYFKNYGTDETKRERYEAMERLEWILRYAIRMKPIKKQTVTYERFLQSAVMVGAFEKDVEDPCCETCCPNPVTSQNSQNLAKYLLAPAVYLFMQQYGSTDYIANTLVPVFDYESATGEPDLKSLASTSLTDAEYETLLTTPVTVDAGFPGVAGIQISWEDSGIIMARTDQGRGTAASPCCRCAHDACACQDRCCTRCCSCCFCVGDSQIRANRANCVIINTTVSACLGSIAVTYIAEMLGLDELLYGALPGKSVTPAPASTPAATPKPTPAVEDKAEENAEEEAPAKSNSCCMIVIIVVVAALAILLGCMFCKKGDEDKEDGSSEAEEEA